MSVPSGSAKTAVLLAAMLLAAGCMVGPKYDKPTTPQVPAFKEQIPPEFKEANTWKVGEPRDDKLRGKWWEVYKDPQLNSLEEQVQVSNLTVAQAEAQFRQAAAAVRIARADLYPSITAGASVARAHASANRGFLSNTLGGGDFQFPVANANYEADVWGRVRNNIAANVATAQASAADLATMLLSMNAMLATDYFELRGLDAQKQLLESTVVAYERALELTINRHDQGVASGVDVEQARTQLETTRAQSVDVGVQRSQLEHAIAVLIGKPPAEFTIPPTPLKDNPPPVPIALPSELLERRPDIANAERQVAVANAQIGVAKAAYYPTISLTAAGTLESNSITTLFQWPSRVWSIGASLVETVFDAGRRRAATDQAMASYDAMVAAYRLSVLTAFQDVEDNLAALRVLSDESKIQDAAVKSAERTLELSTYQYKGGITTYLQVITAQSAALSNEVTALNLLTRRMTASVALVKALGGGWADSSLPTATDLMTRNPASGLPPQPAHTSEKPKP